VADSVLDYFRSLFTLNHRFAVVQSRLPAALLRRCEIFRERQIVASIFLSRREGDGFRGRSDGGLPNNGTSPSKKADFDGDLPKIGTSPSFGAREALSTAPLHHCAMCCERQIVA